MAQRTQEYLEKLKQGVSGNFWPFLHFPRGPVWTRFHGGFSSPAVVQFWSRPMEVPTWACLETAQWKMRAAHQWKDRYAALAFSSAEVFPASHVHAVEMPLFQSTPRRQSTEGREDATPRKPLGSPSRATSTPTRSGLSENRWDGRCPSSLIYRHCLLHHYDTTVITWILALCASCDIINIIYTQIIYDYSFCFLLCMFRFYIW